jgi:hypothetical protein
LCWPSGLGGHLDGALTGKSIPGRSCKIHGRFRTCQAISETSKLSGSRQSGVVGIIPAAEYRLRRVSSAASSLRTLLSESSGPVTHLALFGPKLPVCISAFSEISTGRRGASRGQLYGQLELQVKGLASSYSWMIR